MARLPPITAKDQVPAKDHATLESGLGVLARLLAGPAEAGLLVV